MTRVRGIIGIGGRRSGGSGVGRVEVLGGGGAGRVARGGNKCGLPVEAGLIIDLQAGVRHILVVGMRHRLIPVSCCRPIMPCMSCRLLISHGAVQ